MEYECLVDTWWLIWLICFGPHLLSLLQPVNFTQISMSAKEATARPCFWPKVTISMALGAQLKGPSVSGVSPPCWRQGAHKKWGKIGKINENHVFVPDDFLIVGWNGGLSTFLGLIGIASFVFVIGDDLRINPRPPKGPNKHSQSVWLTSPPPAKAVGRSASGHSATISSSLEPSKPSAVCLRYRTRPPAAMVPKEIREVLFSCQNSMDIPQVGKLLEWDVGCGCLMPTLNL